MSKTNKIVEIARLLGVEEYVRDGVLTMEHEEYVLTLCEKDALLQTELLYKTPCSRERMGETARRLVAKNHCNTIAGFFMDTNGLYGQRYDCSVHEAAENVACNLFVLAREALKNAIYE